MRLKVVGGEFPLSRGDPERRHYGALTKSGDEAQVLTMIFIKKGKVVTGAKFPPLEEPEARAALEVWAKQGFFRDRQLAQKAVIKEITAHLGVREELLSCYGVIRSEQRALPGKRAGWDEFAIPPDYSVKKRPATRFVPGETIICPTCFGEKTVICARCGGTKSVTCRACGGRGDVECSHCQGSQKLREPCGCFQGRDGWGDMCGRCLGSGYREASCSYCWSGKTTCIPCRGRGNVECNRCDDLGRCICEYCHTEGEVTNGVFAKGVIRSLTVTRFRQEEANYPLPASALRRATFGEEMATEAKRIEEATWEGFSCPPEILSLQERTAKRIRTRNGETEFIGQRLSQRITPVYAVVYDYEQRKNSTFFLYGEERRVCVPARHWDRGRVRIVASFALLLCGVLALVFRGL